MKAFIILGMHRSATSLMAQGLHRSGIHMGSRLLGAHASNTNGHYEDVDFIYMNDKILKSAGGSWDNPPSEKNILLAAKLNEKPIRLFIESKQIREHWGWKDPRTILTIKCYMPHLENPHFIACYRNPKDVAESLNKRDGMPIDQGIALAKIYNDRLSEFMKEFVQ